VLCCRYEIKEVDGVKQPPVKVGSGVTNAQGVFLVNGPWVAGDHTIVVDSAPNFAKPNPVAVSTALLPFVAVFVSLCVTWLICAASCQWFMPSCTYVRDAAV
jgi:hypothetical protein